MLKTAGEERGQVLILVAVLLTSLLGVAGLVIDTGHYYAQRRQVQNATDAATRAAAYELKYDAYGGNCLEPGPAAATTAALQNAAANGFNNDGVTNTVTVNLPPASGPHAGDCNYMEVLIDQKPKTFFIQAVVSAAQHVKARAVSVIQTLPGAVPPYNFVSLNTSCNNHTLLVKASGQLTVNGSIYVNSCSSDTSESGTHYFGDAFDIFGTGGNITANDIRVVGGWETHNNDTVTCPNCIPSGYACGAICLGGGLGPAIHQPVYADPFAAAVAPSLGTPACTSPVYGAAVSYNPKVKLTANITASQTTITTDNTGVQNGDMIVINTEDMLVTGGGGTTTLTVVRAQNGTTAATHNSGTEVKKLPVTAINGTAASPAACTISSGTVTLQPGTYYGGICIGASGTCSGACTAGTAHVTLNPGTYIMAGGGFWVCGSSQLSAPHVMIYNTNDPTHNLGAGLIDQVVFNTTGTVTLGPNTSGTYAGLTIFQDRALTVKVDTCNSKSSKPAEQDIALWAIGNGINGISGTFYAANQDAMFADSVSGTANLAVFTGCIYIDGANSTFNLIPQGLFSGSTTVSLIE